MRSWVVALNNYSYPVNLRCYEHADRFPDYFNRDIIGDRNSTTDFENYFREKAQQTIEVYFEVIFWKLYSQANIRQKRTTEMISNILGRATRPSELYNSIRAFAINPNRSNLQNVRLLLSIGTNVLAVPLTFVAFLNPEKYPMVDNVVARWVNANYAEHNRNRQIGLTPFTSTGRYTSLRDIDFPNYLNWAGWCNEIARILTDRTGISWRPRDVEMAVFTAERDSLELNVL